MLGFWCPQDIVYPRFCPEKFECTRPQRRHKCPEGRYCLQGTVKGLPCGGKDCPKGTNVPSGGAFFLFYAAILALFAYGCFYFRGKYTEEKMSRQNQELEDYYQAPNSAEIARQAGREVLFTIVAASAQCESAWRPRTRRLRLTHPNF